MKNSRTTLRGKNYSCLVLSNSCCWNVSEVNSFCFAFLTESNKFWYSMAGYYSDEIANFVERWSCCSRHAVVNHWFWSYLQVLYTSAMAKSCNQVPRRFSAYCTSVRNGYSYRHCIALQDFVNISPGFYQSLGRGSFLHGAQPSWIDLAVVACFWQVQDWPL